MPEIKTRCQQGQLIVTDQYIRVQLGQIKQQTLARSSLVGVDSAMATPNLFGLGRTNLLFRGQGDTIKATMVKTNVAKEILSLLGY